MVCPVWTVFLPAALKSSPCIWIAWIRTGPDVPLGLINHSDITATASHLFNQSFQIFTVIVCRLLERGDRAHLNSYHDILPEMGNLKHQFLGCSQRWVVYCWWFWPSHVTAQWMPQFWSSAVYVTVLFRNCLFLAYIDNIRGWGNNYFDLMINFSIPLVPVLDSHKTNFCIMANSRLVHRNNTLSLPALAWVRTEFRDKGCLEWFHTE